MKRSVVYLPSAQEDLRALYAFLARESPSAAQRWRAEFEEAARRLAAFPESAPKSRFSRLAARGYRVPVVGEVLAFYVVRPTVVEMRRIVHGRRRYEPFLGLDAD